MAAESVSSPLWDLQVSRDPATVEASLHHHDVCEIFYLVSGDVSYTIEGRIYRILPGNLMLICPSELHRVVVRPEGDPYERYVLRISPDFLSRLAAAQPSLQEVLDPGWQDYRNLFHLTPDEQRTLLDLLSHLRQEQEPEPQQARTNAVNDLIKILAFLHRMAAGRQEPERELSQMEQAVSDIARYIGSHYAEPLSLDSLANQLFLSRPYLSHEFTRFAGTSFHQYVRKKRTQMARQAILRGARPGQAWNNCGFKDYTTFYYAFKAEYGTTPSKAEQQARQSARMRARNRKP